MTNWAPTTLTTAALLAPFVVLAILVMRLRPRRRLLHVFKIVGVVIVTLPALVPLAFFMWPQVLLVLFAVILVCQKNDSRGLGITKMVTGSIFCIESWLFLLLASAFLFPAEHVRMELAGRADAEAQVALGGVMIALCAIHCATMAFALCDGKRLWARCLCWSNVIPMLGAVMALGVGGAESCPDPSSLPTPGVAFNSTAAFEVYVVKESGKAPELIGKTPSSHPLSIPPCERWWVKTVPPVDMAKVRDDIQAGRIPVLWLSEVGDDDLVHLKGVTELKTLWLDATCEADACLVHVEGLIGLQSLLLSATDVTDAGLLHLKGLTGLKTLHLRATKVTDAGLVHLKGLTRLETLHLSQTKVTDAGLAHLKGLTGLKTLHLSATRVTGAGLVHLNGLTGLKELRLSSAEVTDAGLVQVRSLTGLRTLDLHWTKVTDAGLVHLTDLTGLRRLDLSGTQVTDTGLVYLKGLTGLRRLELGATKVTNAGLVHLKGLTGLKRLSVDETNVTGTGVVELRKVLPRTKIRWP